MTKLVLDEICHSFSTAHGDLPLFERLSLSVKTGEVVSIVGASGVGKTTLFNIAAGLIHPDAGDVIIDGHRVTGEPGHVGYMLQKDLLLPFKTVYQNIALPLVLRGLDRAAIDEIIAPKLTPFGLDGLADQYPSQISGGQRQRAALLRTYLSNNALMLLDEPFSALDFVTKSEMYEWFLEFSRAHQLTCLIITHDIDEAIYLSDHVYVLKGFPAQLSHHFMVPKGENFLQSQAYLELKQQILMAIREL